jgi:2-dehydro-3-deoxygalactonokinase
MDKLLSCDWGTSSFRLRLVNSSDLSILAARMTAQGIKATYSLWEEQVQQAKRSSLAEQSQAIVTREQNKISFYQTVLSDAIKSIGQELGFSLDGIPLVISGMASSSLGMQELPYKELPFLVDGSDLRVERFSATAEFKHDTILISGARTADDVMRGEETQLVGCEAGRVDMSSDKEGMEPERVFIFPGTHSKHVLVRGGRVIGFKTYMTGEFFELLSKKSILAGDVGLEQDGAIDTGTRNEAVHEGQKSLFDENNKRHFEEGVREGAHGNLLHGSFLVRTNRLLQGMSKKGNHYYLSGLLIGAELKELIRLEPKASIGAESGEWPGRTLPVTVVGEGVLMDHYIDACRILGMEKVQAQDGGGAVLRGQAKIARLRNRL